MRDDAPRKFVDLEAMRALAHPRRLRIWQFLDLNGPATSAMLAAELGLNTGATSYHLRELASHGFVTEVPTGPADGNGGGAPSRRTCALRRPVARAPR